METLKLWHWRALVLLAYGYSSYEVARRLNLRSVRTLNTLARLVCACVCADEQRDGRRPLAIVRVWATLNLSALNDRVRTQSAPAWLDVPDVVTEARLGAA